MTPEASPGRCRARSSKPLFGVPHQRWVRLPLASAIRLTCRAGIEGVKSISLTARRPPQPRPVPDAWRQSHSLRFGEFQRLPRSLRYAGRQRHTGPSGFASRRSSYWVTRFTTTASSLGNSAVTPALLMFAKYSVGAQRAAPALARHLLCPKTTLYSAGINKGRRSRKS